MFKSATVIETLEALKADGAVLVDVRTEQEWKNTGIADVWEIYANTVVSAPNMELMPEFVNELEKNVAQAKSVYFICRSGQRSQVACALAQQSGYNDVFNVEGGMNSWIENSLPIKAV